ncbi:hypothetical protein MVEN_01433200 [Mycena venus]|uniref:Uncharacterized protein n=1 Tax=Mycena venus TaxID=2733690 RepID=A0A8H6XVS2_9AGAR|nr:hypothetical protein MVEN_01433200 [Mycena venus]
MSLPLGPTKSWDRLLLHSSASSSHAMSTYTIDAHAFDIYYHTALQPTFETCTQLLLFGILLVLLFNTTYLLHTRIGATRCWLVATTCAMGLFAALHLALQIAITVLSWRFFYLGVQENAARALSVLSRGDVLNAVDGYLVIVNNIVTDGLFIHPLSLLATIVVGSVGERPDETGRSDYHDYRLAFGITTILTNLTLMALTAGRIWWIRRDVVTVLEPAITRTYDTIIAMILESGAIYCISIILYLILVAQLNKQNPAISVFRAAIPQIMNITPILILVRVGSGQSFADETSLLEDSESSKIFN